MLVTCSVPSQDNVTKIRKFNNIPIQNKFLITQAAVKNENVRLIFRFRTDITYFTFKRNRTIQTNFVAVFTKLSEEMLYTFIRVDRAST